MCLGFESYHVRIIIGAIWSPSKVEYNITVTQKATDRWTLPGIIP